MELPFRMFVTSVILLFCGAFSGPLLHERWSRVSSALSLMGIIGIVSSLFVAIWSN